MENRSYVAVLNGTPIYAMSAREYIKMRLETINVYNEEHIYMIVDRQNYLIQGNKVMGKALDHCRRVKRMSGADWMTFLKDDIEAYHASNVVITERPTVEFLSTEGEKKLNSVILETKKAVEDLKGVGEKKLEEVAKIGEKALDAQVKNTNVIVRKTSRRKREGS